MYLLEEIFYRLSFHGKRGLGSCFDRKILRVVRQVIVLYYIFQKLPEIEKVVISLEELDALLDLDHIPICQQ
jgi:hypothetical protein